MVVKPQNLLVLMSDEHNPKITGYAGHPMIGTPALDTLAARGSRFTAAYTPSPICVPARASLATGLPVHRHRAWDNAIAYDGCIEGWAHALRAKGGEGTKGNADQQSTRRAQDRASVSQALERIRQAARQRKKERFTSLLHHVDRAMLRTAFYAMKRDAAPGVDGMTWETYEQDLDRRIETLHERVQAGTYRALPSRRSYIPKEDGSKRPLAVAALEDKIVQRAVAAVLSAIYEEDFLGFSYGFRPKRSQHDALDALIVGISSRKVNYILDADIRSFFTEVSQQWVVRFLKHRIGDKRIIRFVQK